MHPFVLLAGGAVALYSLDKAGAFSGRSPRDMYAPAGRVLLYPGVPYRMAVRLDTGSGSAEVVERVQTTARQVLEGLKASAPHFYSTNEPPLWAPKGSTGWGNLIALFEMTPTERIDELAVGKPFPLLGPIEWMMRLDFRPFMEPPGLRQAV